jgi:hypothetical protein
LSAEEESEKLEIISGTEDNGNELESCEGNFDNLEEYIYLQCKNS